MSQYWKDEIRSIVTTAFSFLVVDGVAELMNIWNGDWSKATLYALLFVLARSLVKSVLSRAFPAIFPLRKSNPMTVKPINPQNDLTNAP